MDASLRTSLDSRLPDQHYPANSRFRRASWGANCDDDNGAVAQLGERHVRNVEVVGSIPIGSTSLRSSSFAWQAGGLAGEGRLEWRLPGEV